MTWPPFAYRAGRLRRGWERVRPVPLSRDVAGTPKIGGDDPLDPHLPPTALTLGTAAMSDEAANAWFGVAVATRAFD